MLRQSLFCFASIEQMPWLVWINNLLAPYRMPALMILSGMLLGKSLGKRLPEYLWGKTSALAWPYVLWAGVFLAVSGQIALLARPQEWVPVTYLWFILFLYLYYLAAPLVSKLPRAVVMTACLLAAFPFGDSGFVQKFLVFAAFFFGGYDLSRSAVVLAWLRRRSAYVTLLVAAGLASAARVAEPEIFSHYIPGFALSACGVLGLIGVLSAHDQGQGLVVRALGRSSIAYYLSHYPAMVLVVLGLTLGGITSQWVYFTAALTMALGVGWLLARVGGSQPWSLLLRGPRVPAVLASSQSSALVFRRRARP